MDLINKIKERTQLILYTLRHKIAFLKVEKNLLGHNTLRGVLHDADKPFLYCLLWLSKQRITEIHRNRNKHHVQNNQPKTKADDIETIIDWECARLTKKDKPLNAYETLMKLYPQHQDRYLPIIAELLPHQIPQKIANQPQIKAGPTKIHTREA